MKFLVAAGTDVGIKKKKNEDSLTVKRYSFREEEILFAVLCDGMGGLEYGEIASASIIQGFHAWAVTQLPGLVKEGFTAERLKSQWEQIVSEWNGRILNYGRKKQAKLGSTIIAVLMFQNQYYILNVGDCRIYEIQESARQLTEDQTLVQKEVKAGRMTEKEAEIDSRRNVLLECVGAIPIVHPDMYTGRLKKDAVYLVCSDGFRHVVTKQELAEAFAPERMRAVGEMRENIYRMIELNKQRRETDNISAIIIRTY